MSNDNPRNPSAFPQSKKAGEVSFTEGGMNLRDYFAAKAMAGDWAAQNEFIGEFENDLPDDAFAERAATYYRMADAMLAEREREE